MSDRAFGRDRLERSRSYPRDPRGAKEPILAPILRRHPRAATPENAIAALPLGVISFAPCGARLGWGADFPTAPDRKHRDGFRGGLRSSTRQLTGYDGGQAGSK